MDEYPTSTCALDDLLSRPDERVVETMRKIDGDFLVLGVGGKMGPSFARLVKRATDLAGIPRRVFGVSRFAAGGLQGQLQSWGIETIACDLLCDGAVDNLPDAANVVSMLGFKFGAGENPSLMWAMNCDLPAVISRRYRDSRIAAFSSGNVYGMVDVESGGSRETDRLRPVGEYAASVLGRERIYDHFSRTLEIPVTLLRLNYATELRYGVLVDLAQAIWNEQTIDLTMGFVNVIWQRDANAMAINALRHAASPPRVWNIAGDEILRIRDVCNEMADVMGKQVQFRGSEASDAFLNQARHNYEALGGPTRSAGQLIRWTAAWVAQGGPSLNKPTHFQNRGGDF